MENKKVKIINMVNHRVGIIAPEINFKAILPTKDAFIALEQSKVEQLMFNASVRNMIDDCIIYIEDMEVKKELGLEPEDAVEPVNIVPLTNERMEQLMGPLILTKFKAALDDLSSSQIEELCSYAIANRITNYDKCKYIKEQFGRDILKAIELSDQNEEK